MGWNGEWGNGNILDSFTIETRRSSIVNIHYVIFLYTCSVHVHVQ